MEEQSPVEGRIDPISLFPEEVRQGINDLTYLGYLTKRIEFCGHTFVMETVRPHMKLILGQALEPYRNTIKEPDAWAALNVAMALTSIDGHADFCPPVNDSPLDFARARLHWITGPQGYWQPTIDYLFGEYALLEQQVMEHIAELHRLSLGSRAPSQPSPDSSTAQGPSADETGGDTPPTEPSS